jgi:hypothetical protein
VTITPSAQETHESPVRHQHPKQINSSSHERGKARSKQTDDTQRIIGDALARQQACVCSRALGPVAVRFPVGVAPAAGLPVARGARRHAAADAAALLARPAAHVLARVRAAPKVARAAAVCKASQVSKQTNTVIEARSSSKHDDEARIRAYLWPGRRSGAAQEPAGRHPPEQPVMMKQTRRAQNSNGGNHSRSLQMTRQLVGWFVTLVLLLLSRTRRDDATKATTTASLFGAMLTPQANEQGVLELSRELMAMGVAWLSRL